MKVLKSVQDVVGILSNKIIDKISEGQKMIFEFRGRTYHYALTECENDTNGYYIGHEDHYNSWGLYSALGLSDKDILAIYGDEVDDDTATPLPTVEGSYHAIERLAIILFTLTGQYTSKCKEIQIDGHNLCVEKVREALKAQENC